MSREHVVNAVNIYKRDLIVAGLDGVPVKFAEYMGLLSAEIWSFFSSYFCVKAH